MESVKYNDIDSYIADFPHEIQEILEKIRVVIKKAAPEASEAISYGMPTFKLKGNLVHFAAFKNHIGFFPTPKPIEVFSKELTEYVTSKGTIRFPLDKPIPYDLISRIAKHRAEETQKKLDIGKKKV
jgi:uncharacterized protein YdhG (YjbR/CyaY superfamily)